MVKKEQNPENQMVVGMVIFALLSTRFDGTLHTAIAWIFGYRFKHEIIVPDSSYLVISASNIELIPLWLFFMLPAILIFSVYLIVAILKPDVAVLSLILTVWTNLTVYVHDSIQAEKLVVGFGYSELQAQILTSLIPLTLAGLYYYLIFSVSKTK